MSHNFSLNIQTPCSEKFENFQKTESGGFCQSCQKEVIDFTKMTDREIFRFFENQKEKACGRLGQTQLKMYSEAIQPNPNRRFGMIGAGLLSFSLLSFFPFGNAQAQQKTDSTNTYISLFDSLKNVIRKKLRKMSI